MGAYQRQLGPMEISNWHCKISAHQGRPECAYRRNQCQHVNTKVILLILRHLSVDKWVSTLLCQHLSTLRKSVEKRHTFVDKCCTGVEHHMSTLILLKYIVVIVSVELLTPLEKIYKFLYIWKLVKSLENSVVRRSTSIVLEMAVVASKTPAVDLGVSEGRGTGWRTQHGTAARCVGYRRGHVMNCPDCGENMDIVNQTPRCAVNVCCNQSCPSFDRVLISANEEYEERILPKTISDRQGG